MPYKDKQKARSQCREYHREWYRKNRSKRQEEVRQRKEELAVWLTEYKKALKCQRCPENHPACIDFHHRDSSQKEAKVSDMLRNGCSKESILREIEKCDPLCSNCHRKLHWKEKNGGEGSIPFGST